MANSSNVGSLNSSSRIGDKSTDRAVTLPCALGADERTMHHWMAWSLLPERGDPTLHGVVFAILCPGSAIHRRRVVPFCRCRYHNASFRRKTTMSRPRILVINPNSNHLVTQGLENALKPLGFDGGPEIVCETLAEGPYGIESQADVDGVGDAAAPSGRRRQPFGRLRHRLLQRSGSAGLPRSHRPARVRHRRMRRADGAGARRNLRRHCDRAALDPPPCPLSQADGPDGSPDPASGRST